MLGADLSPAPPSLLTCKIRSEMIRNFHTMNKHEDTMNTMPSRFGSISLVVCLHSRENSVWVDAAYVNYEAWCNMKSRCAHTPCSHSSKPERLGRQLLYFSHWRSFTDTKETVPPTFHSAFLMYRN